MEPKAILAKVRGITASVELMSEGVPSGFLRDQFADLKGQLVTLTRELDEAVNTQRPMAFTPRSVPLDWNKHRSNPL